MSNPFLFPGWEPEPDPASNGRMFFSPNGHLSVSDVVAEFLKHRRSRYTDRSLAERRRVLDRFTTALGNRKISECRPLDLDAWLLDQTGWKSPATRRTHWNLIQAVFNWAGRVRLVADNPFRSGEAPESGEPRPAVPDEWLLALLRHTDACFRRLLVMLRKTSLREGELCDLIWPWVDFETKAVRLEKFKGRRQKKKKVKIVPLTKSGFKLLCWLRRQPTERRQGKPPITTVDGHVFLNAKGTRWKRENVSTRMQRLRKRAGVPDWVKPHGLRHQIGTEAIAAGAPLKLVSQGLGHAQTAITERFYVHLAGEHLEQVREALEQGAHIRKR